MFIPDKTDHRADAYGKTKDMMRVYEELTGVDFPYNKYDQTIVAEFQFRRNGKHHGDDDGGHRNFAVADWISPKTLSKI